MKNNLSCSEITKRKIANSLKELMTTNTFDKITVSDITNHCNIHRQTFYYHFQDRYELLDWLLYNEIVKPLVDDFNINTMFDRFHEAFKVMYNNKRFFQNALKINPSDMTKYISKVATDEFAKVIQHIGEINGIETDEDDNTMIAEFFGYGLSGVVVNWASRGMKETPEQMVERIEKLVSACKTVALNS